MASIIKKMNIGFGAIFLLLLASANSSYQKQKEITDNFTDMINVDVKILSLSEELYAKSLESRLLEKEMILYASDIQKAKSEKDIWEVNMQLNNLLINDMLEITKKSNGTEVYNNIKNFQEKFNAYQKSIRETYDLIDAEVISDSDAAIKNLSKANKESTEMIHILHNMVEHEKEELKKQTEELKAISANSQKTTIIYYLLLLSTCIIIARVLITSIKKPLLDFNKKSKHIIQSYDLNTKFEESKDEIGEIAKNVNLMLQQISNTIGLAINNAKKNSSHASAVVDKSGHIRGAIEKQSQEMSKNAAAVEELTTSITLVSDLSKNIQQNMSQVSKLSDNGISLSNDTKDIIQNILLDFQELTKLLQNLEVTSNNISSIVSTIRDIADQTNLLALNAAIEAARAGEAGRGFAVVADEVRKLSENTAKATTEISSMIQSVQNQSKDVTQVIVKTNEKVQFGVTKVVETNNKINEIGQLVEKTELQINEIANSLNEERVVANDIAQTVEEIALLSEKNATNANDAEIIILDLPEISEKHGPFRSVMDS